MGVSQFLNQENSMNMNTRLNIDNDYFNSNNGFRTIFETNILKSDYGNSNLYKNDFSRFSNHFYNNPNYSQITDSSHLKGNNEKNNIEDNYILGKKCKKKDKKKDKKNNLNDDSEKKQKVKKKKIQNNNNNITINNNNNINNNNQNRIFNTFPPQYFSQIPKNIDIPYPSQFIEK